MHRTPQHGALYDKMSDGCTFVRAQDSPDQAALLAAFDFGELEGATNQVLFGFITKGKACWNDVKQDVRDAYMRDTMYAALGEGRAEKLWHVHHEAIDVNGRLGESLEETHLPFNLARCTLRSGVKGGFFLPASKS